MFVLSLAMMSLGLAFGCGPSDAEWRRQEQARREEDGKRQLERDLKRQQREEAEKEARRIEKAEALKKDAEARRQQEEVRVKESAALAQIKAEASKVPFDGIPVQSEYLKGLKGKVVVDGKEHEMLPDFQRGTSTDKPLYVLIIEKRDRKIVARYAEGKYRPGYIDKQPAGADTGVAGYQTDTTVRIVSWPEKKVIGRFLVYGARPPVQISINPISLQAIDAKGNPTNSVDGDPHGAMLSFIHLTFFNN